MSMIKKNRLKYKHLKNTAFRGIFYMLMMCFSNIMCYIATWCNIYRHVPICIHHICRENKHAQSAYHLPFAVYTITNTKKSVRTFLCLLVPKAGLEPAWNYFRKILSLVRLPFRHFGVVVLFITFRQKQHNFILCTATIINLSKYSTKVLATLWKFV